MASEEDLRVAEELLQWLHEAGYIDTDWIIDQSKLADSLAEPHTAVAAADSLIAQHIATALTAARAETWKEAIMFVNIADIGDAAGADATYKIGKMLEAVAGSKTKVFSREDAND